MPKKLKPADKVYLEEGITEENLPLILAGFQDLEVMNFVGFAKEVSAFTTIKEVRSFLFSEDGDEKYFELHSPDHKFIGYTSLEDFQEKGSCEFNIFILDKNFWGKGIGLEVTKKMLYWGFEKLGMKKITLTTCGIHTGAINLYKKAGFRKTKLLPADRKIFQSGHWITCSTQKMEITQEDFYKAHSNNSKPN